MNRIIISSDERQTAPNADNNTKNGPDQCEAVEEQEAQRLGISIHEWLDRAIRNVMKFARWDLQQTVRAATLNPAKVTSAQKKGVLERGADADFVVLTPDGDVRATIIKGTVIQ